MTMFASPSLNQTKNKNNDDKNDCSTSYFQKTVTLQDWWLIKAGNEFKGKRLAVAGFTAREKQKGALRVFYSAPITKVYDAFTLETADDIFVILQGFINKTRTIESGFLSGVFGHFVFGFPPNWEDCAGKFMGKEVNSSTENASDMSNSAANQDDSQNKNEEENKLQSRSIDFTTACLAHSFEAEICTSKSHVAIDMSLSKPSTTGHPVSVEQATKHARRSSSEKLGEEANVTGLSFVRKEPVNKTSGRPVRSPRETQQKSAVILGCSAKHKCLKITSEAVKNLNPGNLQSSDDSICSQEKVGITKANLRSARKLRNSSGDSKSDSKNKEKNEQINPKERVSSQNNARRKISFDRHDNPNTPGIKNIVSPDSSSLKRSRSGRPLLPTLDFWRNQIPVYDAGRNLIGISEEQETTAPSPDTKPQQKKKKKR